MGHVVAVAAVVLREGHVLAMRRSADKDAGAGLWETLSGRVEPGEEPLDAMRRELAEESGLEVGRDVALEARPIDAYAARRGADPMVVIVYRATWRAGEVRRSDEHDEHAWLTPAAFRARTTLTRLADAVDLAVALPPEVAAELFDELPGDLAPELPPD